MGDHRNDGRILGDINPRPDSDTGLPSDVSDTEMDESTESMVGGSPN